LKVLPTIDNPKGELQEMLQELTNEAPEYKLESTTGPDHDRVFECSVHHRGLELGRGTGKNKKEAESQAAIMALIKLKRKAA
jgi:ribonuclease-3